MDKNRANQPIGLFDSGVGGLTVMKEIVRHLPNEHLIYFGDTARIPYGSKSPETVIKYSIEITEFLLTKNIKLLVVACNTASAHALHKLKQLYEIPIIGVISSGANKAVSITRGNRIAVLATKGTIQSEAYQKEIKRLLPKATVIPIACPLFVPIVEENFIDHPATKMIIKEYLKPLKVNPVDTIVLGCTHYPLLKDLIQEEVGPNVSIVDSASTCSVEVAELLKNNHCLSPDKRVDNQIFVSDDPDKFKEMANRIFGLKIGTVTLN